MALKLIMGQFEWGPAPGSWRTRLWAQSTITEVDLERLVARGMLHPCTSAMEWMVPSGERSPSPPPGYIVSFLKFHERGLAKPIHDIFRGLLFHYRLRCNI